MFRYLTLYDSILTIFTSVTIILTWYSWYAYDRIKNLIRQLNEVNNPRPIERHNPEGFNHYLNNRFDELNRRNQLLENANRHQSERIEHLENGNQLLNDQIGQLNREIRQLNRQIDNMGREPGQYYHHLIEQNNRQRGEINNLRELREYNIRGLATQTERNNSLEDANRNLVGERNELQNRLQAMQNPIREQHPANPPATLHQLPP
jgi:chromosome segregation ATPase